MYLYPKQLESSMVESCASLGDDIQQGRLHSRCVGLPVTCSCSTETRVVEHE